MVVVVILVLCVMVAAVAAMMIGGHIVGRRRGSVTLNERSVAVAAVIVTARDAGHMGGYGGGNGQWR